MADPRGIFRTRSSPLVPRADRRRQLVALATISGLVIVAFGLWFVAILTSTDRDQLEIAEGPSPAEERPVDEGERDEGDDDDRVTGDEEDPEEPELEAPEVTPEERSDPEPDTDAETESGSEDETDPEPDTSSDDDRGLENGTNGETDTSSDSDAAPESDDDTTSEPDTDPASDTDDADAEDPDDTDVVSVTIDGVCTVEVDAEEGDAASLQAWDYADCAYAPVPLDDGGERWIVVRASMPSGDVDAPGARERASDLGVDGGVLWSSHYPSLSPGFWVAYDGPFPDVEAARNAAEAVDGDAYARALAVDGRAG